MAERPEDLNLPNAVVTRIIKDAIPEGVNISKEARLAISKAASVFVLYATSCANNLALKGKRKTISATDVISSMEDMEFDQFIEPLQQVLEEYRKEQKSKKDAASERKKKVKEEEKLPVESDEEENRHENGEAMEDDGGEAREDTPVGSVVEISDDDS